MHMFTRHTIPRDEPLAGHLQRVNPIVSSQLTFSHGCKTRERSVSHAGLRMQMTNISEMSRFENRHSKTSTKTRDYSLFLDIDLHHILSWFTVVAAAVAAANPENASCPLSELLTSKGEGDRQSSSRGSSAVRWVRIRQQQVVMSTRNP